VRPTRDGIHGREYISTAVELGRKLNHLTFDAKGQLTSSIPDTAMVPIPILFDIPMGTTNDVVKEAMIKAAAEINTCAIVPAAEITPVLEKYSSNIIPLLSHKEIEKYEPILKKANMVEIEYNDVMLNNLPALIKKVKTLNKAITIIRVPAVKEIEAVVAVLAHNGAEVIHIAADYRGREISDVAETDKRLLKNIIRGVHQRLVEDGIRDEITIIASGGIAMAEQVPKAMLCGADLTTVDIPLMVALGMRIFENPEKLLLWPEGLDKISPVFMKRRIVNLMGAWHSQILEMMGAMGIREARRLRGESGRAIFFEDIDRDTFGKLFKKEKR